ncbi:MAG: DUF7010 family protein [Janthinobacterium lividum]
MHSINTEQTVELSRGAVSGRATGALFFLGFGTVWMFVGLKQTHHASRVAVVAFALVSLLLLVLTVLLMRSARNLPAGNTSAEEEAKVQRMFNAVNIIQWVSVAAAILVLNMLRMPEYIVPAIAVIVGLHLFPLATAFQYRQHYLTGTLLVLLPLACLLLLPRERVSGVCASGVAAVLMASATATLLRTFAAMREAAAAAAIPQH